MKAWLGMGDGTLPGDVSLPDDEHPGAGNIRKRTGKRKPVKKNPSKQKHSSAKPPSRTKRKTNTGKKK